MPQVTTEKKPPTWVALMPWYYKLLIAVLTSVASVLVGAFTLGAKMTPAANAWFDRKWEEKAGPRREFRDQQIKGLHERLDNQQVQLSSMDHKLDILIQRTR
jgi:hypothetical protein